MYLFYWNELLVAWFDRGDGDHTRVTEFFDGFEGCLLTTWPVLTEVCHLVPDFFWRHDS